MIVDVFQDTVCPWCRIGKHNLKTALTQWQGEAVEVRYHPFFLNPNTPPEGYDFKAYMAEKFGGMQGLSALFEGPRKAGERVGLTFNFDKVTHSPNSLDSHRLVALAPEDKREAMLEAIYKAYFEDGLNIGDIEVLATIAEQQGLDKAEITAQLRSDVGRDDVRAQAQWASEAGVSGVPLFVFNGTHVLSGAHPPTTLLSALQQASETVKL